MGIKKLHFPDRSRAATLEAIQKRTPCINIPAKNNSSASQCLALDFHRPRAHKSSQRAGTDGFKSVRDKAQPYRSSFMISYFIDEADFGKSALAQVVINVHHLLCLIH